MRRKFLLCLFTALAFGLASCLIISCDDDPSPAGSGYTGDPVYPEDDGSGESDGDDSGDGDQPDGDESVPDGDEEGTEEPLTGACDPNPCTDENKTKCSEDNDGNAVCSCDEGFQNYGDGACLNADPCAADTACADIFRACENDEGEAICGDCLAGYYEEGEDCLEETDCSESTCSGHGECDDSSGNPVCDCEVPYTGDHCETCETPADWPPELNWWNGRFCQLPACDEAEDICFDSSGTWQRTLTTVSETCDNGLEAFDPRAKVGNVSVESYELGFVGACDYKDGEPGTQTGTIHGNTEISCDTNLQVANVFSVETSVIVFDGDVGTGTANVFLYDVVIYPDCVIEFDVLMERQ